MKLRAEIQKLNDLASEVENEDVKSQIESVVSNLEDIVNELEANNNGVLHVVNNCEGLPYLDSLRDDVIEYLESTEKIVY